MTRKQPARRFNVVQLTKQLALSGFVVMTFVAYSIHDRLNDGGGSVAALPAQSRDTGQANRLSASAPTGVDPLPAANDPLPSSVPPSPTDVIPTATVARSGVQDGQFTGEVADAYYGYVQVRAIIQGGRLADVQFLTFPQDRRTSARINSYAVPALRSEAIQAQNAQVDIISGATLTSEAFVQSLQSALSKAGV